MFDMNKLVVGLTDFEKRAITGTEVLAKSGASKMETYAKTERKWTDRTSRARQGLNCTVSTYYDGFRLTMAHSVDYGVALEYWYQKRYAIIMPTIEAIGEKEVLPSFKNFISKI